MKGGDYVIERSVDGWIPCKIWKVDSRQIDIGCKYYQVRVHDINPKP